MENCKNEDECETPMWCRGKDKCQKQVDSLANVQRVMIDYKDQPEELIPARSKDIPRSLKDMENRRVMQALTPAERLSIMFNAKLKCVEEKIRIIKKR